MGGLWVMDIYDGLDWDGNNTLGDMEKSIMDYETKRIHPRVNETDLQWQWATA